MLSAIFSSLSSFYILQSQWTTLDGIALVVTHSNLMSDGTVPGVILYAVKQFHAVP